MVPGPQRGGLSCGAHAGCSGWLVGLLGGGAGRIVVGASPWAVAGESSVLAAQLVGSSSVGSVLFSATPAPPSWCPRCAWASPTMASRRRLRLAAGMVGAFPALRCRRSRRLGLAVALRT